MRKSRFEMLKRLQLERSGSPPKKKKRQAADASGAPAEEDHDNSDVRKTKKKRKDKSKSEPDGEANDDKSSKQKKHKKKSKKSVSPYPDPLEDSSLSDQSQKGLVYAYQRAAESSDWKFNKARQNWLTRNLWSEEMVPEKYFPLVIRYLADTRGGACDALIQNCNRYLPPTEMEGTAAPEGDSHEEKSSTNPKSARARQLLDALVTPN
ncbi:hypothetical protein CONPUDRAFT_72745 [Coniophora puteana RWD-64-598 SS2]|uniref:WKF domain-containing protein n=1 Tax=Coniophora puteana (strain RWD-64-598) TaxID=741705 RepID=A0A5M3MTR0_CONPW|nr:uncharacterized protein CONPUDRAFT_72745 [Coniophora puteana RWD-64-598 SS2]EIW82542.1 hypothetical protein CONPUDRAFT_72745 [Coniophora puteana RWD-64-598 SS2]